MDKGLDDVSVYLLEALSEDGQTLKKEPEKTPIPEFGLTFPPNIAPMKAFTDPYVIPPKYVELTVSMSIKDIKELKRHHDLWRDDCWDHLIGLNRNDRFGFYLDAISSITDLSIFEEKLKRGRRNYLKAVISSKLYSYEDREKAAVELMRSNSLMENFADRAKKVLYEIGSIMKQLANNTARHNDNFMNAQARVTDNLKVCAALVKDAHTSIETKMTTLIDVLTDKTDRNGSEFEMFSNYRFHPEPVLPNQDGRSSREKTAPPNSTMGHPKKFSADQSEVETALIIPERRRIHHWSFESRENNESKSSSNSSIGLLE
ncbi:uncharacterized protein LOC143918569 [Arctopsyche grandis]|uniref:uncharacterized protein LOC143918569 n=1 Tax=Arctopsyche grandis TaxID=121162 RepID=UPI00406D6C87